MPLPDLLAEGALGKALHTQPPKPAKKPAKKNG